MRPIRILDVVVPALVFGVVHSAANAQVLQRQSTNYVDKPSAHCSNTHLKYHASGVNLDECRSRCSAWSGCNAWSLYSKGNSSRCQLYTDCSETVFNEAYATGVKVDPESGFNATSASIPRYTKAWGLNCTGSLLTRIWHTSLSDCRKECTGNEECGAFTHRQKSRRCDLLDGCSEKVASDEYRSEIKGRVTTIKSTENGISGFVTFLEVKCTDVSSDNFISLIKDVSDYEMCAEECMNIKDDACQLMTYDTQSKECFLFKRCGKSFEHKWIDGINDPELDEVYDVTGFVTAGRVASNGYFITPPGSYCKKTTGNSKHERKCETIQNGEHGHFFTDSLNSCMELCDTTPECIEGVWIPDKSPQRCRLVKGPGGASLFLSRAHERVSFKKQTPTSTVTDENE